MPVTVNITEAPDPILLDETGIAAEVPSVAPVTFVVIGNVPPVIKAVLEIEAGDIVNTSPTA